MAQRTGEKGQRTDKQDKLTPTHIHIRIHTHAYILTHLPNRHTLHKLYAIMQNVYNHRESVETESVRLQW